MLTSLERRAPDIERTINRIADVAVPFISRHWLAMVNATTGLYLFLAALAPLLMSIGFTPGGNLIYLLFRPLCNQLPSHSFFIFGHQMACCERCAAIYGSFFAGGLFFILIRQWIRPLRMKWYLVLITPMAIDGFTQLFGWRVSTWELRVLTGSLFGLASVWLTYPLFHRTMREITSLIAQTGGKVLSPAQAEPGN